MQEFRLCSFVGGNSGIGKETAIALAARGARVIIACRDVQKAEVAVREIKTRSRSLNVSYMELDLANLQSVREFCKTFLQKEQRLDILINNAGENVFKNQISSYCLPSVLHLQQFRVITLTSSVYKYQKLDFQDLNYNIIPFFTFCRSKLANIYFTQELSRLMEGKGVTAYAVHPGFVQSNWTCHFSILFRVVMQVIMYMFSVSCEVGAQTVIYCAVSADVLQYSGGFFSDCQPAPLRPFARDAGVAKKLWEASERMVKLP
ncbi:RDH14 dehydrogenase, partial [Atractosteus spatula]|nr:RDH14 dehydrogenase [Atractosteus spatula]